MHSRHLKNKTTENVNYAVLFAGHMHLGILAAAAQLASVPGLVL
jgi:hypothetical protein